MRSLQRSLGLGLLFSLIVSFIVLWLIISFAIRQVSEGYIASRLEHDSETILSAVQLDTEGKLTLDESRINAIYKRPFSGHYYLISTPQESKISRSVWDYEFPKWSLKPGEMVHTYFIGPQQQPLLLIAHGYKKQNRNITITVAEDLSPIEADIRNFQWRFTLTAVTLLIILIIVQIFILRLGLSPLARIRKELVALSHGETKELQQNAPSEILPLVQEINHLVKLLGERLQRTRNALGDLAHAIKKPLTVLQQISDEKTISETEIQHTLQQQTRYIQGITDRILKQARLAGEGPVNTLFSMEEDLPALIDTLGKIHQAKGISIHVDTATGMHIRMDREDMLELLGNVLDNACKWARSTVDLKIRDDNGPLITIEDDGPGVDDESLSSLAKRGVRLDEQEEGHGLGLSIVQGIVEQYHGQLAFSRSESLNGLKVTIRFPKIP